MFPVLCGNLMKISKQFKADFAHIVTTQDLPDGHRCKCRNIHGHSFKFTVEIIGNINPETGMVVDYTMLKPFKDFIDNFLDHSLVIAGKDFKIVREMAIIHKHNLPQDESYHALTFEIRKKFTPQAFGYHGLLIDPSKPVVIERIGTLTTIHNLKAVTAETLSMILTSVLAQILYDMKQKYGSKYFGEILSVKVAVHETETTSASSVLGFMMDCVDFNDERDYDDQIDPVDVAERRNE